MPKTESTLFKKSKMEKRKKFSPKKNTSPFKKKIIYSKSEEGYVSDNELDAKTGKQEIVPPAVILSNPIKKYYHQRLVIGDADCSFSKALLEKHKNKHPGLPEAVTITTYESEAYLQTVYTDTFPQNKSYLTTRGASLFFNVDGRRIHHNFAGQHFQRIHFNFPHDRSDYNQQTLPKLLADFFTSARELQKAGDKIHIALPRFLNASLNEFYKGCIYNIYEAALAAGYRLVKKRFFDSERYPGYQHVMTGEQQSAQAAQEAREYIFEKTNYSPQEILELDIENDYPLNIRNFFLKKKCEYTGERLCLPELQTDEDSSSYETDSEVISNTKPKFG